MIWHLVVEPGGDVALLKTGMERLRNDADLRLRLVAKCTESGGAISSAAGRSPAERRTRLDGSPAGVRAREDEVFNAFLCGHDEPVVHVVPGIAAVHSIPMTNTTASSSDQLLYSVQGRRDPTKIHKCALVGSLPLPSVLFRDWRLSDGAFQGRRHVLGKWSTASTGARLGWAQDRLRAGNPNRGRHLGIDVSRWRLTFNNTCLTFSILALMVGISTSCSWPVLPSRVSGA